MRFLYFYVSAVHWNPCCDQFEKCALKKTGIFTYIWRLNAWEVAIYVCTYRKPCYVWKDDVTHSVIDSVGAPFHFAAFHCDLRTELALLYMYLILLHYCLPVFVSTIESLFIVEIYFTCIPRIQIILLVMGVVILWISLWGFYEIFISIWRI